MFFCRDKLGIFRSLFIRRKKKDGRGMDRRQSKRIDGCNNNADGFSFMCIKSFPFLASINILERVKLKQVGGCAITETLTLDYVVMRVKSSNAFFMRDIVKTACKDVGVFANVTLALLKWSAVDTVNCVCANLLLYFSGILCSQVVWLRPGTLQFF